MLPREVYMPLGGAKGQTASVGVSYIDDKGTREEFWCLLDEDDAPKQPLIRRSHDNGKTWTFPVAVGDKRNLQLPGGGFLEHRSPFYDPGTRSTVEMVMLRQWPGLPIHTMNWETMEHPFVDHCLIAEDGKEIQMRYEDGAIYDPDNPFDPDYLNTNRSYHGYPEFLPDGRAFYPMICYRQGKSYSFNAGGLVLMRREEAGGDWKASNQIYIEPDFSSRGLLEPDVVELKTGKLLIVCRDSNMRLDQEKVPGRKRMSISTDGGQAISEIDEFRYDDGTSFISPSSIHRFFRSTRNGRLYWLANILDAPAQGNMPRHPLYICEIDEDKVAVKKDSLVLVDERRDGEPDCVQLSNFSVIEDRDTLDIEIYITRLGETPGDTWDAKSYRYIFSPSAS